VEFDEPVRLLRLCPHMNPESGHVGLVITVLGGSAERVPLSVREVSSVLPPEATLPWKMPTLSVMAVIAAVVVGALISTVAV
jgi:hypothetical protein